MGRARISLMIGMASLCLGTFGSAQAESPRTVNGPLSMWSTSVCWNTPTGACADSVTVTSPVHVSAEASVTSPAGGYLPGLGGSRAGEVFYFSDTVPETANRVVYVATFHMTEAHARHNGLLHSTPLNSNRSGARVTLSGSGLSTVNGCSSGEVSTDPINTETGSKDLENEVVTVTFTVACSDGSRIPAGSVDILIKFEAIAVLDGSTPDTGVASATFDASLLSLTAEDVS